MRLRFGAILCGVGVLAVCLACGGGGAATQAQEKKADDKKAAPKVPAFKADVAFIMNTGCVGCHNAQKKKGGVDVSSYDALMRHVKAGDPAASRLYKSLTGKGAKLMPPKSGLPDRDVEIVRAWIAAGAKND